MPECVKCGRDNQSGLNACPDCAWPLKLGAWRGSRHQVQRVTIDTNCLNQKQQDASLNLLERWAAEGRLILERAPAMLHELKGPPRIAKAGAITQHRRGWVLDESLLDIDTYLSGPDMEAELIDTLFPTTTVLNSNQRADVEHLRSHVRTGADVFVTRDAGDFIASGKQVELRSFGIWVLEPSELVALCQDVYGWS